VPTQQHPTDIILLGTEAQVGLAAHAARELVAGRHVHTHELVVSLRDPIRQALAPERPSRGPETYLPLNRINNSIARCAKRLINSLTRTVDCQWHKAPIYKRVLHNTPNPNAVHGQGPPTTA
jgi:hypothetical protein